MVQISSRKREILRLLVSEGGSVASQSFIGNALNISKQAVSKHIHDLNDRGLIRFQGRGNSKSYHVTEAGYSLDRLVRDAVDSDDSSELHRLHYVQVKYEYSDPGKVHLPGVVQRSGFKWLYDDSNKSYTRASVKGARLVRLTGQHLIIHMKDVYGRDPEHMMTRALIRAAEIRDDVTDDLAVNVSGPRIKVKMATQEFAHMRSPLALWVSKHPQISLGDIEVRDQDDGRLRFHMDESEDVPEHETTHQRYAEDDAVRVNELLDDVIHSKSDPRVMSRMDRVERNLEAITDIMRVEKESERSAAGSVDWSTGEYYTDETVEGLRRCGMR